MPESTHNVRKIYRLRYNLTVLLGVKIVSSCVGYHAPVANENHFIDPVFLSHRFNALHDRGLIRGVAFKDFHRNRSAVRVGEQANDDLHLAYVFGKKISFSLKKNKTNQTSVLIRVDNSGLFPFGAC